MRLLKYAVAVVGLSVVVAGCGGSGDDPASAGTGDSTLNMGTPVIPTTLLPASDPTVTQTIPIQYGSTLYEYDVLEPGSTTLPTLEDAVPALATDVERTDKGLVFTLAEAEASSGEQLDAADVIYSYERMVATEDSIGTFVMSVAGVDMEEPVTELEGGKVRLNGATGAMGMLAAVFPYMAILDKDTVDKQATDDDPWAVEWLKTNSATFGPYDIASFTPGERMTLVRNDSYFGEAPAYEKVNLVATGTQSVSQLLGAGTLQWASSVPNRDYVDMEGRDGLHSETSVTNVQNLLQLNQQFEPFADPAVRRALSMAIDREKIASTVYNGVARPSRGPVSTAIPGLKEMEASEYDFDLAAAQEELASSNFGDGFEFTLAVNRQAIKRINPSTMALALQEMFKPLGIEVEVQEVANSAEFLAGAAEGRFDAFLNSEGAAVADMAYSMATYRRTDAPLNYTKAGSAELDKLIETATALPMGPERQEAAEAAVEAFNDEMFIIAIVDESDAYVASTAVCGFATFPYMAASAATLRPCD